MKFNKYQTELTDELLNNTPKEVIDELYGYINNVPFIQNLVSPNRKYARDLERDDKNRIIVDLSNPHILENMDYFRETVIHYQKYGCFTKLKVNRSPQSEFMRWFKKEINRCWHGMIREEDGEWITGEMYVYLNYFPIIQTEIIKDGNREYGERIVDFPKVWEGVYWRFHYLNQARYGGLYNDFRGNQHAVEIASRGKSKSYSLGSLLVRSFLLGNSMKHKKKVKALISAYKKEYLTKDGLLNKFVDGINFLSVNSQFPSRRLKNSFSEMHWISGSENEEGQIKGSQNEVVGVAVADDPDKLRGKRSDIMGYEEFGTYPKFLDIWTVSLPNVQEGNTAFGLAYAIGTGGSEGSDFTGALEMILYPIGYNVYGLPNVYDKGSTGQKRTVFFYPSYVNAKGYDDHNGVSDVIGAMINELQYRYNLKYNSSDPVQLTRRRAEYAFTLQDAIMKRDSTIYPVADLNDRIEELDNNPQLTNGMWIGRLELINGKVEYRPDNDIKAITSFPHKDNKMDGAVVISKMPVENSDGVVPWGRYIAGADTYDDDTSETVSLFSGIILDLWKDEIVLEYTGRPMFADDAYETWRRCLLMYNAECNYENNKKGLFSYFSRHNSEYLLSDTLDFLKEKELMKPNLFGNKAKGTTATAPIKSYSRRCIRDYLLKPIMIDKENENGEIEEITIPNLKTIKFRALLQELAMWSEDLNTDRHDALGMTMLLREDKLRLIGEESPDKRHESTVNDPNYLGNDPFFKDNYKEYKTWK